MNFTQHRISSGILTVIAIAILVISFTREPAAAYLFPRIISVFFTAFAVITFAKAMMGRSRVGTGLSMQDFKNICPGLVISLIYIFWGAKTLGFYTGFALAFFALLSAYDPAPNNALKTWLCRLIITICVVAVMFLLFSTMLQVHTPRGLFR